MKFPLVIALAGIMSIPLGASAGRDASDLRIQEQARQRVIQQRAFEKCLADAKTESSIRTCHEILKRKA